MTFEDFLEYLKSDLKVLVKFDTLAGRSDFDAIFHEATSSLEIKNKPGNVGLIDESGLRKIFKRYMDAPSDRRNKTSYYEIQSWGDSPNMIYAPYVAAVIRSYLR